MVGIGHRVRFVVRRGQQLWFTKRKADSVETHRSPASQRRVGVMRIRKCLAVSPQLSEDEELRRAVRQERRGPRIARVRPHELTVFRRSKFTNVNSIGTNGVTISGGYDNDAARRD